jgi:AcrR family transcriptional regulator
MTGNPHAQNPGTRQRLLDTAERLFAERGFAGASVREITDAARTNLGAVNYHFQSKQKLYVEVFARRVALLRDPVVAVARTTAGVAGARPDQALRAFGRAFLAPHGDRDASQRLLGLFARETIDACLPPGLLVRELLVPTIEAATGILRRARSGLSAATARACAHSFLAQLMHIVKGAGFAVGSTDQQLEHAVRFTVAAVRCIEDVPGRRPRRKTRRKLP